MSIARLFKKRQSNSGLLRKGMGGGDSKFSNFKMSYLIQYLSYVHTVLGFQLLLTRFILNSGKILNFNFKTNIYDVINYDVTS